VSGRAVLAGVELYIRLYMGCCFCSQSNPNGTKAESEKTLYLQAKSMRSKPSKKPI
jgi:hypothetical protein